MLRETRTRVAAAVAASNTSLTDIFGVGPIIAAILIGYSGDPTRFASAGRYPAYTGTVPRSSCPPAGGSCTGCPDAATASSTTLHMAAFTQIRHAHSRGRGYYDRKIEQGHTPREALRALERRLSNVEWRHLVADARRVAAR